METILQRNTHEQSIPITKLAAVKLVNQTTKQNENHFIVGKIPCSLFTALQRVSGIHYVQGAQNSSLIPPVIFISNFVLYNHIILVIKLNKTFYLEMLVIKTHKFCKENLK